MFPEQKKEKSLIIVHSNDTKQCADFLSGLIGEMSRAGYAVNAVVYDAKRFASAPAENKSAKQKIIYIGDFPEVVNNINKWQFDKFGIRYGWLGNKAVISFSRELSEEEYHEMVSFAKNKMKEYEPSVFKEIEKKGLNPFNHLDGVKSLAIHFLSPMLHIPILKPNPLSKIYADKDKLNTFQIKEQQQKFAVLNFYLEHLTDFMELESTHSA